MTEETKSELEEWVETLLDACKTYKDDNAFLKQIFTHELVDVFEAGQRSKQLPEFTDEEIRDFSKEWRKRNDRPIFADGYEWGYEEGFNAAIEQMKKKMEK